MNRYIIWFNIDLTQEHEMYDICNHTEETGQETQRNKENQTFIGPTGVGRLEMMGYIILVVDAVKLN